MRCGHASDETRFAQKRYEQFVNEVVLREGLHEVHALLPELREHVRDACVLEIKEKEPIA